MKWLSLRSLLPLCAMCAAIGSVTAPAGAQPPNAPATTSVDVPGVGKVVLVNREQLRFKSHTRMAKAPAGDALAATPTPPSTFDWAKGESLKFPILGNDRYGDCYYAAVGHASQTYTGNSGAECQFDVNLLTRRYLRIAGGDNGLDDQTIMPEWKRGIVGPDGPHKIVDEMTVSVDDEKAQQFASWAFGGLIWTCSLPSGWANNAKPGAVWDAGQGRSVGGHAMFLTGKQPNGNWDVRTWGISPPVQLTPRGLRSADSELIVAFSMDQFKTNGRSAFTGLHYKQQAALWRTMGGKDLPPSPFPDPEPDPVPPGPPAPPVHHVFAFFGVFLFGFAFGGVVVFVVMRRKS